jgi:hypothetical protein
VIHLYVADQVDVDLGFAAGQLQVDPDGAGGEDPIARAGNERIVSLRTQTGNISVHNVDITDDFTNPLGSPPSTPPDQIPDDPFRYAALGETTQ